MAIMVENTTPPGGDTVKLTTGQRKRREHTSVYINRRAYSQHDFDDEHEYEKPRDRVTCLGAARSYLLPGDYTLAERMLSLFPVILLLRDYKWKEWLHCDIIAGLSVGIIHIPQGMAFSLLAGLPAVYGVYSSLFPVLCYFIFGTSRHISFGTMALISLFIVPVVDRETEKYSLLTNGFTDDKAWPFGPEEVVTMKVGVACSLTLLAGVVQILMGTLRMGVIASFMSTPFISGFMTGAGFHITASQLKSMLGLTIPKIDPGIGSVLRTVASVCVHLNEVKLAELVTMVTCTIMLIFIKEYVNVKFPKIIKIPIPAELIVVGMSIYVSYYLDLHALYGVKIIGDIPSGLPSFATPLMANTHTYLTDAILIAVLSFVISISMAKMFAAKNKYTIDADQELRAYGISHVFGAFFQSFAGAQAPPRTLVNVAAGGKTQLASVFSVLLVLLYCTVATPLVEPLPKSVLACITVVALLPLFKAVFVELPMFWKMGRYDLFVWVITWSSTTFLTIPMGLVVGMIASCLTVIAHTRTVNGYRLRRSQNGEHVRADRYKMAGDLLTSTTPTSPQVADKVYVFRYPSMVYFVNVDSFVLQLYAATINPGCVTATTHVEVNCDPDYVGPLRPSSSALVVVDCCEISYVDTMFLTRIFSVRAAYDGVDVTFTLAGVNRTVISRLNKVADQMAVPRMQCYLHVDDAIAIYEANMAKEMEEEGEEKGYNMEADNVDDEVKTAKEAEDKMEKEKEEGEEENDEDILHNHNYIGLVTRL